MPQRDLDSKLRNASGKGNWEEVKLLISQGADVHANDDGALKWAKARDRVNVVKYLESI